MRNIFFCKNDYIHKEHFQKVPGSQLHYHVIYDVILTISSNKKCCFMANFLSNINCYISRIITPIYLKFSKCVSFDKSIPNYYALPSELLPTSAVFAFLLKIKPYSTSQKKTSKYQKISKYNQNIQKTDIVFSIHLVKK